MVRADSNGEYQGAISGQAKGVLSGNFYLMEELAGLDGVDYQDIAHGLDFEAFSQLDFIPSDFLTFSYRFEVNGQMIAEIPFSYGAYLDVSQVPPAPQQDGQYGQWPSFPTQNLRRSMVLQAQFASPTSVLSDQGGVANLLVEGIFSPDASLNVQQGTLPTQKVDGCIPLFVWSYSVSGSQSDTITLRLRADGLSRPAAAIYQDGSWSRVDCTVDGSYLVFSGPVQGEILLMEEKTPILWTAVFAAGAAAVLLIAGLAIRHGRRTRLNSKQNQVPSQ